MDNVLNLERLKNGLFTCQTVAKIKRLFKPGTKVRLIHMFNQELIPDGECGVIDEVDGGGTIWVDWECGRNRGLEVGYDMFEIVEDEPQESELEELSEEEVIKALQELMEEIGD